ncbi:MAG: amidinotransferase [Chitinophagaceae bacterium]|nr:amidinotransferase [Chitinophagaceae bacterium]
MQSTSHVLMIKPVQFGYNAETAVNNRFQSKTAGADTQAEALREFENLVALLHAQQVDVTVVEDSPEPHTPDSIFPNNWVSFHESGKAYLYPMFAVNRRQERKQQVLDAVAEKFMLEQTVDLSSYEANNRFLEGTGSMVLDRDQKIAYACLSPRTDLSVLDAFCNREGYRPVSFHALDAEQQPIYHTNVMMCVADTYVVICLDSIPDAKEKQQVSETITASGKRIITIDMQQLSHFAGNMLQLCDAQGQPLLVMSTQAFDSLNENQRIQLERYNRIVHTDLGMIEKNGGGSARCMIAEIFLSPNVR